MRRKDKEITDLFLIEDILQKALLCRIAFSCDDKPYLATVNYGYADKAIYFHSAHSGRKIDIIKQNNNVCFQIDADVELKSGPNPCSDWGMRYRSVVGFGRAHLVEDSEEKAFGLTSLMEHYSGEKTDRFSRETMDSVAVIKIVIESMTGKQSGY